MKRVLGLLPLPALFLGGLLANPLPAQEASALAPEGTFFVMRFASLDRLSQIAKQLAPFATEEDEDPALEMLGHMHSMEGVDRAKPIFQFTVRGAEEPVTWYALPVQDAEAFQEGMHSEGKPLMKSGYALFSEDMDPEEGTAPPKLGVPGLGLPTGDVSLRLLPGLMIKALDSNQIAQLKLQIGFLAPAMLGLNPEQTKNLGQLVDQVIELAGKLQALDLAFACGTEMSLTLGLTGAAGTELADLGGLIKAGSPHPSFGAIDPLAWGWMGMELAPDAPKAVAELYKNLMGMASPKAFAPGGSMALAVLSNGAMFLAGSSEVRDTAKVGGALSSKEGMTGLFLEALPELPLPMGPMMGGFEEEGFQPAGGLKAMLKGLFQSAEFQAAVFAQGDNPVHSLSMPIPGLDELPDGVKAATEKLFPGGTMRLWAGMTGKHLIVAMGPEDAARRLFASAAGGAAALPGFAKEAVIAAQVKAGALIRTLLPMFGEELPAKALESMKGLPDANLRFTLIPKGPGLTARLSMPTADLAAIFKAVQGMFEDGDDDEDDDEDEW